MTEPSRRRAMSIFAGLGCSITLGAVPAAVFAQSSKALPSGPMRLTRLLERTLRGGAMLSVNRGWQVEFSRRANGNTTEIVIDGVQVGVNVSAPTALSSLATIEEGRSTDSMWPIRLTDAGTIVSAGSGATSEDIEAAIAQARAMIAARPIPASQIESQQQYLREMQRAGSSLLERLPSDLFFPFERPLHSLRSMELPSGLIGEFEVTYDARSSALGGWLQHAEREIVTRIGQSEQRAKEQWTLAEL